MEFRRVLDRSDGERHAGRQRQHHLHGQRQLFAAEQLREGEGDRRRRRERRREQPDRPASGGAPRYGARAFGLSERPAAYDQDRRLSHQRSEEHTSELQSLMRISYAVFCLKKKTHMSNKTTT